MEQKQKSGKNLLIALVILVAIIVAGYFYATRDRSTDVLLTSVYSNTGSSTVQTNLLTVLRQLRTLRLDDAIFSDPVWLSLRDFGQTLSPQPSGRVNPFAPLGTSDSSTVSSNTPTGTTTATAR